MKRIVTLVVLLLVGIGAGTGARIYMSGSDAPEGAEAHEVGVESADTGRAAPDASAQALAQADAHEGGESDGAEGDTAEVPEVERLAAAMRASLKTEDDDASTGDDPEHPDEPVAVDSDAATDSLAPSLADADSAVDMNAGGTDDLTADASTGLQVADSASSEAAPLTGAAAETSGPNPTDTRSGIPSYSDAGTQRLAKIFGAMDPRDAAEVLQGLTDVEVSAVLVQMSERKVASILSSFEPDRAASLSRTVLLARNGGTP